MAKDLFDLSGRAALVTGGAGILGRGFCQGLADFGAKVAVVDIRQEAAAELAEELTRSTGNAAIGLAADITNPDSVAEMAAKAEEALGPITILHNNAAGKSSDLLAFFAPFEEYSLDQWREIMSVNVDGMMLVAQAVGGRMIRNGQGGSIIQTSSIYGLVGPDARIYEGSEYMGVAINTPAVYSTSKAAVIGLTRWLATSWAKHGIRVNTLTPGGNESGQNDTFKNLYSSRVPMGRMGQPSEMVGALIYLASEASSYTTGQNIVCDGGWTAW
ncbi:MAG: SDR family oxidoreductase [Fimbriimonadaceae bacterium]|nr:SDR family oxidoreductase [Fimbriimonadaceae bacterium]